MDAKHIYKALHRHFFDAWMRIENSYLLGWESDYLCWVDKQFWCEVEVKVTRADFKRDFSHKPEKHRVLADSLRLKRGRVFSRGNEYSEYNEVRTKEHWYLIAPACRLNWHNVPNRFYFACPEGLIQASEVPRAYGLIWIKPDGKTQLVKRPTTLHRDVLDIMQAVAVKQHFVVEQLRKERDDLTFELDRLKNLRAAV